MKNYYRILNIRSNAASEEIKASYRKLAKRYHPDANPDNAAAAETFADINEAYRILSDQTARARYDAQLQQENAPRRSAAPNVNVHTAARPVKPQRMTLQDLEAQAQLETQKAVQAGVQAQLAAVHERAYKEGYTRGSKDGQAFAAKRLADESKKYKQQLAKSARNQSELEEELFARDRELAKANDLVRDLRARLQRLQKALPLDRNDPVAATIDETKFRTKELENAIADIHISADRLQTSATAQLNDRYTQLKRRLAAINGTLGELDEEADNLRAQHDLQKYLYQAQSDDATPEEQTAQVLWKHFGELLSLALAGDADAQNALGELYYKGDKIARDLSQAVYWFREAVAQHHPAAIGNLGKCYLNGEGVRRNKSIGLAYLRQAENLGATTEPPRKP